MAEYIITDEQLDKLANKHERIIVLRSDCGDAFPVSMKGEILRGLVRCKDCRYCKPYEAMKVEGYKCTRVSTCFGIDLDCFCKWGEPITANGGDSGAVR